MNASENGTAGGDGKAINRHSVRYYAHDGKLYHLDRETDVDPRGFILSEVPCDSEGYIKQETFGHTVQVNGEVNWGPNLSWNKAELELMKHFKASGLTRDDAKADLNGKLL